MAQTVSPDQVYPGDSPSGAETTPESPGKTSLFGKIKNKTRDKTSKLRSKVKGSKSGRDESTGEPGGSSSSSSSEDEADAPVNNAVEGISQPKYEKNLSEGIDSSPYTQSAPQASPNVPATDFPGSFVGLVGSNKGHGGSNKDESELSKSFEGLSTDEKTGSHGSAPSESEYDKKPVTEKVTDSAVAAKETAQEKLTGGDSEQKYASPDAPAAAEKASEKAEDVTNKAADAGKTWSQWAAEKVGYGKDAAATGEGKSAADKTAESAVGAKDAVHEQAVKPAYDQAVAAKDAVAGKASEYQAAIPSDPAKQTYTQKATTGVTGAFASLQPGDHDKALSDKVTDSVGNLPASIKSSLGFGGKTSATPTTTPAVHETPSEEHPQSPGLVSRFTSLWGGGGKKPTDEASPAGGATDTDSSKAL